MEHIVYNFYFLLLSIIFLPNDLPIQPLSAWPLLFSIRSRWFYCIPYCIFTTASAVVAVVVVVAVVLLQHFKAHANIIRQCCKDRKIENQQIGPVQCAYLTSPIIHLETE